MYHVHKTTHNRMIHPEYIFVYVYKQESQYRRLKQEQMIMLCAGYALLHIRRSKAKRLDLCFLFICTEYNLNIRGVGVIANSKSTGADTNSITIDSVFFWC